MRNPLFPSEITDGELADFAALATGWPGLSASPRMLDFAERSDVVSLRHELREFLREAQGGENPTAKHQNAARVATLALRACDAELDLRSELGNPAPRTIAGRKTSAGASDDPTRPLAMSGATPQAARSMAVLFAQPRSRSTQGEFASFADFALTALTDPMSPRLRAVATTYGSEGVGSDGGFAVPVTFVDAMLDEALSLEVVRPLANIVPISSVAANIPAFDLTTGTGGKRAGLELKWSAEAAAGVDQKAILRAIGVKAHKGRIDCPVTNELLEDAIKFPQRLGSVMAAALASGLDTCFIRGTGAGQPLGVLNSPCLLTVNKESTQGADTFVLRNATSMLAKLAPTSQRRAVWLVHPDVYGALLEISVVVKNIAGTETTGGAGVSAISYGPDGEMRLFGRPVISSELCSPIGDLGDVLLADFGKYLVAVRREARLETSIHANWSQDMTAFRLSVRLDGMPEYAAPQTLRDGVTTVSPFVTLQAR